MSCENSSSGPKIILASSGTAPQLKTVTYSPATSTGPPNGRIKLQEHAAWINVLRITSQARKPGAVHREKAAGVATS